MDDLSPTTDAPDHYGHYRLERIIGRGGMAVVHAATNERTGADVALKVVHNGTYTDEVRARFEHEASIAGKLEHRNIVRVYDFIKDQSGASVLVMERLRGETVAAVLARREKLTLVETLSVLLPVLSALDHTHRQGVVHRDVKPSNIFLARGSDGEVVPKLLDFGIATRPETSPHLTADDEVLGTPRAMSPEQIRGDSVLDGRSDLFSLASVMIEMMTGEAPFGAKTAASSLVAVLEREIDCPVEIPPRVFVELARALRKRPYERHATANELAQALREAAAPLTAAELDAALRALEPEDGTSVDLTQMSSAPVERRKRPLMLRRAVAPLTVGLAFVTIAAFAVGSKFGGNEARSTLTATSSSSLPSAATSADPSKSAWAGPREIPPPPPIGAVVETASTGSSRPSPAGSNKPGATSAQSQTQTTSASAGVAPKGSAKPKPTKPVATRPDF